MLRRDFFVPKRADLHGSLYENKKTGINRQLFWGLYVYFQPFSDGDWEEEPNLIVDWMTLTAPEKALAEGFSKSVVQARNAEASMYVESLHNDLLDWQIEMRRGLREFTWKLDYKGALDCRLLENTDQEKLAIAGTVDVSFDGIRLVKSNFSPTLSSEQEAMKALEPYFPEARGWQCIDDGFRYRIKPETAS